MIKSIGDLIWSIGILLTGLLLLIFGESLSNHLGKEGNKHRYTKDQVKTRAFMSGIVFVIGGVLFIINYFFRH